MPRSGYRLDRDGNHVPHGARSKSTNYGCPTEVEKTPWDEEWDFTQLYQGDDLPSRLAGFWKNEHEGDWE